jgi:hypothetical protein
MVWVGSASVCFANALQEELELNSEILVPIINNFNNSSSFTRLVSLELIEMQRSNKIMVDPNKRDIQLYQKAAQQVRSNPSLRGAVEGVLSNCRVCLPGQTAGGCFADAHQYYWTQKASSCAEYAELVMIAFEFNLMNYVALGKAQEWPFKEAVFVKTSPDTGDHGFVLVEGVSGAVFAIDPWIWRVVRLYNFPKLSDIKGVFVNLADVDKTINLNQILNSLFASPYKGKVLYDGWYVYKNTEWILDRYSFQKIQNYAHEYNPYMKIFYDTPKSDNLPKFRRWTKKYDELVSKPATPDESTQESKKPENEDL